MTLLSAFVSIVFSGICLAILMLSDKKRYSRTAPFLLISKNVRKIFGIASILPIIILVIIGQFSALLAWFGLMMILGWILAVTPQK